MLLGIHQWNFNARVLTLLSGEKVQHVQEQIFNTISGDRTPWPSETACEAESKWYRA